MQSKAENVLEVTLVLDEAEANWLKSIMQNPFWVDDPTDESPLDRDMRDRFWSGLSVSG